MGLKKIFFIILSFILFQAQAQERILDFDVKIQIKKSGEIQVVENITIKAEGNIFNHGLLRVFPLTRPDKDGNYIDVQYSINSIKKNGITEPYFTKEEDDDWKIYIGDKDVELESGIYKYQISYTIPFQIGYFENYDELYWNITGNEWNFPIDKAQCQIYLPSENDKFENIYCYTGVKGSTKSNCTSSLNSNSTIVSFTAKQLRGNEGLTVAVSFAKGIVNPTSTIQKTTSFYKLIKTNLWSGIFLIGMSLFFFFNWKKYGKDPSHKTIIPEFSIPYNWSPGVLGYVYYRKFTDKIYMASLISTAVKGAVKICSTIESGIISNKEKYEIKIVNKDIKILSSEEAEIFKSLAKKNTIKIADFNYKIFDKAYTNWLDSVSKQINLDEIYQNNTKRKWFGFAVLILSGLAYEALSTNKATINYGFYFGLIVVASVLIYWFSKKEKSSGLRILRGIFAFFIFFPAVGIFFMSFFFLTTTQMIVIGVVFMLFLFYVNTLGKFTEAGSDTVNKVEGFKLYLETAEKDRMNMLNPPELTPQLFEKLFPYAIALGVEIKWGKQFEEILELAKYNPEWYQGNNDSFLRRPNTFLSGFRSSVQNASIDPTPSKASSSRSGSSGSWSSGSSGGGSSGGGGGGGGGGGW